MHTLREGMALHRPVPVLLASGRTSLIDKWMACMHLFYLEAGTAAGVQAYCNSIDSVTSDLGTEFALTSLGARFGDALPFARAEDEEAAVAAVDASDIENLPDVAATDLMIGMQQSMAIPGLLHIIHNAAKGLTAQVKCMEDVMPRMGALAKLLSDRASNDRLLATCYSSELGRQYHDQLSSWRGSVYEERWGSIAFCCLELLRIKRILRWGWCKDRYQQAGADKVAGVRDNYVDLDAANDAIQSEWFWAALQILDTIFAVIRTCFHWAESCPCHWRWAQHEVRFMG